MERRTHGYILLLRLVVDALFTDSALADDGDACDFGKRAGAAAQMDGNGPRSPVGDSQIHMAIAV